MENDTFDIVEYLDSEETISEYLTVSFVDPDPSVFLAALTDVVNARGATTVANKLGCDADNLSETLNSEADPSFQAVIGVLRAVGMELRFRSLKEDLTLG